MKKTEVAIFGATSHIGKSLIDRFNRHGAVRLHLYTRSPARLREFLLRAGAAEGKDCVLHEGYRRLSENDHDVLINCVGVGTGAKLRGDFTKWFTVTEEYDNLAVSYLLKGRKDALYISLSSGAVYGRCLSAPAGKDTANVINVNHVGAEDYYGLARLNSEAKHRSFTGLNIVDLRIFSYFSRFIDLSDGYFITELINSALKGEKFRTTDENLVRDYVHPGDLFQLVRKLIAAGKTNAAFDVYSAKPVGKREILAYFKRKHGLIAERHKGFPGGSATGGKNLYYSSFHNAQRLGYAPRFTSLQTVISESEAILSAAARSGAAKK